LKGGTLDHEQAVLNNAADRYLLDDLSAVERQDFEEHFFSCLECSNELRNGAIFIENARAVMLEESSAPVAINEAARRRPPLWRQPWAAISSIAAGVLLAVAGYQTFDVIPGYQRQLAQLAQSTAPVHFALTPAMRSSAQVIPVPEGTRSMLVWVKEVEVSASGYHWIVEDVTTGKVRSQGDAPPLEPGQNFTVLLNSLQVPPSGQYVMIVRMSSAEADEIRYPFTLEPSKARKP